MLCDHCKKNEATVHMTNIINNKKQNSIYAVRVLMSYNRKVNYLHIARL